MPDGVNNQGNSVVNAPSDHSMMISRAANETTDILDSFRNDFPTKLVGGKSLTDLMNEADAYNAQSDYLLANYPMVDFQNNKNYFDLNKAISNISFSGATVEGKTFAALNRPVDLGPGEDFDRYKSSDDFHTYGYTPGLGRQQEYKYGNAMTWGDTIGKAIGGGSQLAYDTFVEGWKGWGRMANALFSWDSSKLMGSEEERYQIAKEQEDIFNKYAIYDTEDSQDSLFNRQFFGTMLQQSGFAVGAMAQYAVEAYLTAGLGSFLSGFAKANSLTKGLKGIATASELQNDFRKAAGVITSSAKTSEKAASTLKNLIPFYGTVTDIAKMNKAGAGLAQMTMTGLGGVKRALSEFNMARSESIFEAASTYKQLKDKLVLEYTDKYGQAPTGEALEKISQAAENASHDNFWTNVGILSVMNRIQFNNMFKSFKETRNIFNEAAASLSDEAFQITGKVGEKQLTKAYQKSWFFGQLGAVRSIAADFGKSKAAWEATKMLGKGLTKIEGSEGVQELLQTASDKGLEDYYYDLYHGSKGYTGKMARILDSIQNPLTDMEGMKTFLMGALTGALISPGSKAISKINETIADRQNKKKNPNYLNKKEQAAEAIALVNSLYDKTGVPEFKKEWLANIKIQNKAAETMEEAAKNHNKYVYYNAKDSAFAKTIASAIKLNMYDSVRDSIKELGDSMTPEEFKQAFGIDPTEKNKQDVRTFTKTVADQVDDYYKTYTTLKDKYGDRVLPDLYKNNTPEEYRQAILAKVALDDVIEILTTNTYKAKQTVKRAVDLQTKISSNQNIGASSMEVLTKMGSEEGLNDHIKILEKEIAGMTTTGITLTSEQKEILKDKKKELELANRWKESHNEIVNNSDEEYSPTAETRAYKSYSDLVNMFNKRAKKNVAVSKQDVDDTFIDIIDYIRLNKDNKSYVDAVNFLTDPYNLDLITNSMITAHANINEAFKKEHKEDVKKATDTEGEIFKDDVDELGKKKTAVKTEETDDLEKHLQKEYDVAKKLNEDKGIRMPDYETWKKTAGVYVAKRYEESKKGKKETTPTKTKKEIDFWINGKPAYLINQRVGDDNKTYVTYALFPTKENETEEEIKARQSVFIVDEKNNTFDEAGNPLDVSMTEPEKEPEESISTSDIKRKPTIGETLTSDSDQNYKVRGFTDNGGVQWENTKDGSKGVWSKEKFDEYIKDGRLKYDTTPVSDIEAKKADIERRRQEELENTFDKRILGFYKDSGYLKSKKANPNDAVAKRQDYFNFDRNGEVALNANKFNEINTKYDAELEALEGGKPEEKITIEPEYEAKDYDNVYKIARGISQGKDVSSPENLHLIANYPKLLEEFLKIEKARQEALKNDPSKASEINAKHDALAKNLIDTYGKRIPKDVTDTTDKDIPAYAQGLDRIKKAQMESDTKYANKEYLEGYRQIAPSNSLSNKTDNFDVDQTATTVKYTRTDVNKNYVFDVATKDFPPGTGITYRVITDQEVYDKMEPNRLTGQKYEKSKIFDSFGRVKQEAYDDVPIGVYATIRGKEMLIGTVHEPLWIQYKINGKYPHIAAPEGVDIEKHVQQELKNNRQIRKTILDSFNADSKFVISGVVSAKSNGILKMVNDQGLLKDRVNPKIGEGGNENRHGFFAIVRNGSLQTDINVEAKNVQETETFTKNINNYSGVPALMLPTPTGTFMPTFIGLPKIDRNQAEFILESWKAFTGKTENLELIAAVYKAVDREMSGGQPDVNVLSEYLNQYYTQLNHDKPLSAIGNGSEVSPGQAIFDIDKFGNMILEVKDDVEIGENGKKTNQWFSKTIRTEKDIPANIITLLQNLRTTIKFNDRRNDSLHGINSKEKITFLTMENGKLISKDMTYNERLLETATTYVDKGTQSENTNKDWVYFANPVVKLTIADSRPDSIFDAEKEEVDPGGIFESDIEDDFAALERIAVANLLTDEQVKEEAEKCNQNPFADA